uniref:Uncharacterized protein n=1 Tax=Seriola lalandi dorsalis TaxID=1841481 RepID=A0A3B4X1C8_SERLL
MLSVGGHVMCVFRCVSLSSPVAYLKRYVTRVLPPFPLRHSNMNIGGIIFPLEQQSRDGDSVVYHGQYDTEGVPHTKSGDRQPVQVSMEVRQEQLSYRNTHTHTHTHITKDN